MIRQDDPKLPLAVNKWGCYFTAIVFHSGVKRGKEFATDEIEAIYKSAMATGIIGKEVFKDGVLIDGCFINDPVALFNLCGVRVQLVRRADAGAVSGPGEIEISHFHRDANTPRGMNNSSHDHFVATRYNTETKLTEVIYDGLGKSNTVRYGFLKSKRIFK
jgi:hypothetical protein